MHLTYIYPCSIEYTSNLSIFSQIAFVMNYLTQDVILMSIIIYFHSTLFLIITSIQKSIYFISVTYFFVKLNLIQYLFWALKNYLYWKLKLNNLMICLQTSIAILIHQRYMAESYLISLNLLDYHFSQSSFLVLYHFHFFFILIYLLIFAI